MSPGVARIVRNLGLGASAILLLTTAGCGGAERDRRDERSSAERKDRERSRDRDREKEKAPKEEAAKEEASATGGEAGGLVPATAVAGAQQMDRRVRILNSSGQNVKLVHGSSIHARGWGEDRIPAGVLPSGNAVVVNFDDGNGECLYDLRATLADDTTIEQKRVNICQVTEWVINRGGGQTR